MQTSHALVTTRLAPGRGRARASRSSLSALAGSTLLVGAWLILASALIHLYLWADGYRHIATIGPLFLAQAIVGLVLGVLLVAAPRTTLAAAGAAYLLASIGALLLSATVGLFGFMDRLDAPWAVPALIVEGAGAALLACGAVAAAASPTTDERKQR